LVAGEEKPPLYFSNIHNPAYSHTGGNHILPSVEDGEDPPPPEQVPPTIPNRESFEEFLESPPVEAFLENKENASALLMSVLGDDIVNDIMNELGDPVAMWDTRQFERPHLKSALAMPLHTILPQIPLHQPFRQLMPQFPRVIRSLVAVPPDFEVELTVPHLVANQTVHDILLDVAHVLRVRLASRFVIRLPVPYVLGKVLWSR
jgi:hypothetical protein